MACTMSQGGGWDLMSAATARGARRIQPARFRNGPDENQAAEKLPMP